MRRSARPAEADIPGDVAEARPGTVTGVVGSLIGAVWIFAYGFVAAGSVAWIYDRVLALRHRSRS